MLEREEFELEYLSRTLNSVEINGSFYALQKPASYLNWAEQTPEDFVFYAIRRRRAVGLRRDVARHHIRGVGDVEGP